MLTPPSLDRLVDELGSLPGIGKKTARRLAYHVLSMPNDRAESLSQAIQEARRRIGRCRLCHNFSEGELCPLCNNPRRDAGIVCVVEKPSDVLALEAGGQYQGLYHVLGGHVSPLDGVGPADVHIPQLVERIRTGQVREVVLALGSSAEAEATALLIDRMLSGFTARRTRLARGIPMGSDLEYVDELTVARAFEGRVAL